jgi:hypothetical protein
MRLSRLLALAPLLLVFGCGSDLTLPVLSKVDVMEGATLMSTVTPSGTTETTITDDVPVDADFDLTFSETIDLTSAQNKIRIRDANKNLVATTLSARLAVITVTPNAAMAHGLNHTLEIDAGILNTTGNGSLRAVIVNFYTAP